MQQRSLSLLAVLGLVVAGLAGAPTIAAAASSSGGSHWSTQGAAYASERLLQQSWPHAYAATSSATPTTTAPSKATAHFVDDVPTGAFAPVQPARLLDTRAGRRTVDGKGAGTGRIGPNVVMPLQVTDRDGIPNGAVAVVVTVVAVGATAPTYVTAYPHGAHRSVASTLVAQKGQTTSVASTVVLGTGGAIDLYNEAGSVDLLVDVTGYYAERGDPAGASAFRPQQPVRLADSRVVHQPLPAGDAVSFDVSVPETTALALNVTAIAPGAAGYLAVEPGDDPISVTTSPVDFAAHQTVADMVVVPTQVNAVGKPSFSLVNESGAATDYTVDVVGYYVPTSEEGSYFVPLAAPVRIVDTRRKLGIGGPLGVGASAAVATASSFGDATTTALTGTVTGLDDRDGTYLTAYPSAGSASRTASVDVEPRGTRANMTMTGLGASNGTGTRSVAILNGIGSADAILDVTGYFDDALLRPSPTVTLSYSPDPATAGSPVAITATVAGPAGKPVPTGRVELGLAGAELPQATIPLSSDGTATWTTSTLRQGDDQIVAVYDGDSTYAATSSAPFDVVVHVKPPVITLRTADSTVAYDSGAGLDFSFTPQDDVPEPTGEVVFTDTSNGSILGTSPVEDYSNGTYLLASGLAPGHRTIVATYLGDANYAPESSAPLSITVTSPTTTATSVGEDAAHDGDATADALDPSTLAQSWSVDLGTDTGDFHVLSTPVSASGRVFVVGRGLGSGTSEIYAFDAATGGRLWTTAYPDPGSDTYGDAELAYDGDQVFVVDRNDELVALSAVDGRVDWRLALPQYFGATSPVAYDGVVYLRGDEQGADLYAVSEATGQLVWRAQDVDDSEDIAAVNDTGVYIGGCVRFGLDGTAAWRAAGGCPDSPATTTLHGERLYAATLSGGVTGTSAEALDTADGSSVGTFADGDEVPGNASAEVPLVTFGGPRRYEVVGGALVAYAADGSAAWTYAPAGATLVSGVVVTKKLVIASSTDGTVRGVDPTSGALLWSARVGTGPGRVSVAAGRVLVSDGSVVAAFADPS